MQFENFLQGHNNAFQYFGGHTRELLYDNLKSLVLKRALLTKDSEFNNKFMDFAGFYGFKPILCRPYKPNTKGKVERSVGFVKQNFYHGEIFISLNDVNNKLKIWLEEANKRIHATVKERPIDRLKRETLISLSHKYLYDLTSYYWRKVSRDCFFSFEGNFYSVPYHYANKEISLKIEGKSINVLYRNEIIAGHYLSEGKGNFIRNADHFKGLLETRCRHKLRKPKKNKIPVSTRNIKPVSYVNVSVIQHELSCYEKVA